MEALCVLAVIQGWCEECFAMFWSGTQSWLPYHAFKRLLRTEDANDTLCFEYNDNNRSARLKRLEKVGKPQLKQMTYMC